MQIIGALIVSTIAGLSTVLGGLVIFFKFRKENINRFITFSLAFSLAIMIGISITDLIPEATFILLKTLGIKRGVVYSFIAFIIGIVLIKYLNKLMAKKEIKSDLYKLGILNMIALMLHNFPEGIATFMSSYKDINLGIKLAVAIAFHNIPEGISIAVPIYYSTMSKRKAMTTTFLSGIAEPLGAIIAYIFLSKYINDTLISMVLLLVGGIMITLAIEVIFPKAKEYNCNLFLKIGITVGFILILINYIAF